MKKAAKITYVWHRVLMGIVFVVGVLGMIFNEDQSVKSEYLFVSAQSGLFLIVSFLPTFLNKLKLDVPDFMYIMFMVFCLAHFLCGEILGFFVRFKWWDSVLHTFSGMMIALLSFSLINLLNNHKGDFKLNMGFAILFAFSLTVAIGVIWEIIEFVADLWFETNMQRAYISTLSGRGEPLVGQDALLDTMKDLILDSIGAAVVCVLCAIFAHKKKIRIEDLSFIKRRKKVVPAGVENADALAQKNLDVVPESLTNVNSKIVKRKKYKKNKNNKTANN